MTDFFSQMKQLHQLNLINNNFNPCFFFPGQSREEIEKWRAERKKNFPTQDKVAIKDAERSEARERGEVLRLEKVNYFTMIYSRRKYY